MSFLPGEHRDDDLFGDAVSLQFDHAIGREVEVWNASVDDRDDGFLFETCFGQFDDGRVVERRLCRARSWASITGEKIKTRETERIMRAANDFILSPLLS